MERYDILNDQLVQPIATVYIYMYVHKNTIDLKINVNHKYKLT